MESIRLHSWLPVLSFLLILFRSSALAATVVYDFNITWVLTNPDGEFVRPTMGINGQWPIPEIRCAVGDRVIVNVVNQLGNQTTSLHFHGLFQNGTTHMDGASGVTQCSIPPGESFRYDFTVDQPGTYWYHAHEKGQYMDGLRGPLIVDDPDSPHKDLYDEEMVLTLSDWYHDQVPSLVARFLSVTNPTGAEPVPNNALMNDTRNLKVPVQPGRTYLFRIINMAGFAAQHLWFEGHTMTILEVDGVYTEPAEATMIYLTAAQRYSVLISTKDSADANFAFVGSMDQDLFDKIPEGLNNNVTGWLVYNDANELPQPEMLDEYDPFDDFALVPVDKLDLYRAADYSLTLDIAMDNLGDGVNYAFFNGVTFVRPKVPTLYTALTSGDAAAASEIYGTNANAFTLKKDDIVEIILNNNDPGKHPFHLHGHTFQTVFRSEDEAGPFNGSLTSTDMPQTPMRRDTVLVRPNGNLVLRFKADNPDKLPFNFDIGIHLDSVLTCGVSQGLRVWLFHCHIEWHVVSGLIATFVEAPTELQSTLKIPDDHLNACKKLGVPTEGNAAGNTEDLYDLAGAHVSPNPLPAGFTARGIVALVFSILSGLIGISVIAWYGASEVV